MDNSKRVQELFIQQFDLLILFNGDFHIKQNRMRDGKLEQGVLREAASRLQQKIQKHLLDSEDRKELELDGENQRELAGRGDSLLNLDKTVLMDSQVKALLEILEIIRLYLMNCQTLLHILVI